MRSVTIILLSLLTALRLVAAPGLEQDVQVIKARLCANLLPADAAELGKLQAAKDWAEKLQADGTWADVNYADQNNVSWATAKHLDRVLILAKAYRNPQCPLFGDTPIAQHALAALDGWLKREPHNPNWWWNDYWQPTIMGNILLLLQDQLTPEQRAAGVRILRRASLNGGGSNLVGMAVIQIERGCLENDAAALAEAFAALGGQVRLNDGLAEPQQFDTHVEGIQPDYTFYQHGRILYSGGYGVGFLENIAQFVYLASGTQFAFPPDKLALFSAHILDGSRWMIRGKIFDFSAIGREITRPGQSRVELATLARACAYMAKVPGPRQGEFTALLAKLTSADSSPADDLSGNRHFWKADFMVHHRKAYYASVRMTSSRLRRSEMVNGEGKRSYYLSDGANYLMRTGDEYRDIFPVWDWRHVPGTTVECLENTPWGNYGAMHTFGVTAFVGGVSDGTYGLAAMDFARPSLPFEQGYTLTDKQALFAKKSWFFFDTEYVCLGAGITALKDANPIVTTLNQCFLRGEVFVSDGASVQQVDKGERVLEHPRWIAHDSAAYLFPEPTSVHLKNAPQTGRWSDIGAGPAEEITRDVFSLWIDHGKEVKDARYSYIVVPEIAPAAIDAYAKTSGIRILSNTPQLQAVRHDTLHLTMAAFYAPSELADPKGLSIRVDKPCLVLLQQRANELEIAVSNPENTACTVNLEVSEARDDSRRTLHYKFPLPAGPEAGKSVVSVGKMGK